MTLTRGSALTVVLAAIWTFAGCSDHATEVQQPPKPYFTAVATGAFFSCAITSAGPTQCWGSNELNQLGRGIASDSSATPVALATSVTFVQLSPGVENSCALDRSGAAYCWGSAGAQLGTGVDCLSATTCAPVPTRVATTVAFSTISAGAGHTCGLDTGGFAWCWGSNADGQLGTSGGQSCRTGICQLLPVPVSGQKRFLSISAGRLHTCAVTDTRDGYCWGYGRAGQLGSGAFQSSETPVAVTGGLKFASIVVAPDGDASCGLTGDGLAYCWGIPINSSSLKQASAVPTVVAGGVRFKQLSVEALHACGIATTGGAYCWGDNYLSAIGEASRDQPTPVATSVNLISISTLLSHTCGLDSTGEVYCWGDARYGELGPGTKVSIQTPVRVLHP
jgi:alpha-tubulin suppressor-like RCC1 family protein